MTLLAGIELQNRALIAADGVVLHTDDQRMAVLREPVEKIWRHPSLPRLTWGFTGDAAIGLEFNEWLKAREFVRWTDLIKATQERLAALNGDGLRLAEKANAKRQAVDVLLVGFLDAPRVVHLHEDGGATQAKQAIAPLFLGGGAPHAFAAWLALQHIMGEAFDPEQCFRASIEAAIEVVPALGGPTQFLETE